MHLRNSWTRSMSAWSMRQVPSGASGGRGLNFLMPFFTWKFQDTSVTRSLISGKVFIGASATGRSRGRSLIRVMHISRGRPLISAEHEPHLPALQFHRTAMSGAWVACSRWITSSTTSPSFTSTVKSCRSPPDASPRHTLNFALYPMSALLRGDVGELAGGEVLGQLRVL